ncbi:MAG TPA: Na(+)/H(+) antiporter NhaB [Rubrivivax sp.]|nr:Na(+)/H(+) antiporter NhaB [Burkholderiales bacterium]HNT37786.1 Na(+)/H(+) antiporter NhaB [Rubrivivax sp.]
MTQLSLRRAFLQNFLGNAPPWYKNTIIGFLLLNPIIHAASPYLAGWLLLCQFLFTLVMSLRCYPLQPGGLLAIEAVAIGMTSPLAVYREVVRGFDVILLLIFMVAGISFLKELLLYMVTKLVISIRSKQLLMMSFTTLTVALSAFLDALTGIAIIITVAMGFYRVYHRVASGRHLAQADAEGASEPDLPAGHPAAAAAAEDGEQVQSILRATRFEWDLVQLEDLEQFRAFLRSLVMHGAVATALGGVMTLVGEPQNLLIGSLAGWDFGAFFARMAPVSIPVVAAGLVTCFLLERLRLFGYGAELPESVRAVLVAFDQAEESRHNARDKAALLTQAAVLAFLIAGLALHLTAVGLIGVSVIVLATALLGIVDERRLGHAFQESLPFTALLVVFFTVVAVIHDQHLLGPIFARVLQLPPELQPPVLYAVNGLLSLVTENVFIATVFITEVNAALQNGIIDRAQFELLAVAVNTGTNIPSIATPNGQAAFLFLLTSALAPLIRLSYMRMMMMALPYTVVMTLTGFAAVTWLL